MMAKNNLMKKLIGMSIFQWALIFYFMSISAKKGATIHIAGGHGAHTHAVVHALDIVNPLPSVLMLTAIVVGVATTGISLALLISIYKRYGTLEEDEIITLSHSYESVNPEKKKLDSSSEGTTRTNGS